MVKVEGKGFDKNGYIHPPGVVMTAQFSNRGSKWLKELVGEAKWCTYLSNMAEFGAEF